MLVDDNPSEWADEENIGILLRSALSLADKTTGEKLMRCIVDAMRMSGWGYAYRGSPGSTDIELVLSKVNGPKGVATVPLVTLDRSILISLIGATGLIGTVWATDMQDHETSCVSFNQQHCRCYSDETRDCCICNELPKRV